MREEMLKRNILLVMFVKNECSVGISCKECTGDNPDCRQKSETCNCCNEGMNTKK